MPVDNAIMNSAAIETGSISQSGPANSSSAVLRAVPHAQESVRVRLMIAIPVMIVLLVTVMGGGLYHLVDREFQTGAGLPPQIVLERFAHDWLYFLLVFVLL